MTLRGAAEVGTVLSALAGAVALVWHFVNWLKGPDVVLVKPEQVILARSDKVDFPRRGGGPYVHVVAPVSYTNAGAAGYNAVVSRETIEVEFGEGNVFEHRWYRFVTSDAGGAHGEELIVTKLSDVQQFPLQAGSARSHETLFQPWPTQCPEDETECDPRSNYVHWNKFMEALSRSPQVVIRMESRVYGQESSARATCKVSISESQYADLRARKWISPICE